MFQSISTGWELAKRSLHVLKLDKELLLFPVLSAAACVLVLASFAAPLWFSGVIEQALNNQNAPNEPLLYVLLFLYYFATYFVIVFFNSALIACALIRFNGGDPTLGDGLRAASARLPQIFAWALVSATVGIILKAIESRSEKAGRFVANLLGMAWGITTYFVVPVLVVEKAGPIEAIKRSLAILRKAWGQSLVGNFGIGLIVFLAYLVAVIPAALGVFVGGPALLVGIPITVILCILIALVSTAAHAILVGALYQYAAHDRVPQQFDEHLLRQAFVQK